MKLFTMSRTILLLALVLFLVAFAYVYHDWQTEQQSYLDSHIRETEHSIHAMLAGYEKLADLIFHTQIETPGVESIFTTAWEVKRPAVRDAMRNTLFERLSPLYTEMTRLGFRQFQFHFPDNTSFLRFHMPEKYGDDLTDVRPTVVRTNSKKVKTVGFEEGRVLNGYRFVYPLSSRGRHVGSVEASISLLPVALELSSISRESGDASATALLVNADEVRKKVWAEGQTHYAPSSLSDRYLVDAEITGKTGIDLPRLNEALRDRALPLMERGQAFALPVSGRGRELFLAEFLPKRTIDGETIGYLVHYHRDRSFAVLHRFFLLRILTLVLLSVTLLSFFLYRQRFIKKLQDLATTDPLTQVQNRRALLENLKERAYLVQRYARPHSLIMFDVDHFKDVNDGFGHAQGDYVLREIVRICRSELRPTDLLARWGGDEFVILLTESDGPNACIVAERIRQRVFERFASEKYNVTLSMGAYQIPGGEADPDSLFARVDAALYRAKTKGRNRVEIEEGP